MALYGSKVCKIEFLHAGFRNLLYGITDHGPGVDYAVEKVAEGIRKDAAAAAGLGTDEFWAEGYASEWPTRYKYPGRHMAYVMCGTSAACIAQAENKVLTIAAHKPREV